MNLTNIDDALTAALESDDIKTAANNYLNTKEFIRVVMPPEK